MRLRLITALLPFLFFSTALLAEDGHEAWLRYALIQHPEQYRTLPSRIVLLGDTPTDEAAATELQRGLSSMLGRHFTVASPASLTNEDQTSSILISSILSSRTSQASSSRPTQKAAPVPANTIARLLKPLTFWPAHSNLTVVSFSIAASSTTIILTSTI
jgi:hypothetical protein